MQLIEEKKDSNRFKIYIALREMEGRIKMKLAEIQDNSIGRNADELLRKVEAAQFVATHDGEVCPAKWKKGAETPASPTTDALLLR